MSEEHGWKSGKKSLTVYACNDCKIMNLGINCVMCRRRISIKTEVWAFQDQSRKYSQGSWKKEKLLAILKKHGFNLNQGGLLR